MLRCYAPEIPESDLSCILQVRSTVLFVVVINHRNYEVQRTEPSFLKPNTADLEKSAISAGKILYFVILSSISLKTLCCNA